MKKKISSEYELVIMPQKIDFEPPTEIDEVIQNIITICTTAKYSVPMDRAFGVDAGFVDEAVSSVKAKVSGEIVRAVKKYEPRARVTQVDFQGTQDGKVYPRLKFRITGE